MVVMNVDGRAKRVVYPLDHSDLRVQISACRRARGRQHFLLARMVRDELASLTRNALS
jgi:hypothetical protein